MDSRVGEPVPIPSAYVSATDDIRRERRRYMSKSQRACDLCRARKSACRIDKDGIPCRLCTAHGRQCTFNSGPIQKPGRSFIPRDDGRQQFVGGTNGTAVSAHATNSNVADLIEWNETDPVPHLARSGPSNMEVTFDTPNDWSPPNDQLFGDALLFTPEVLMPEDLGQDFENLKGGHETTTNTSSDSNLDFGLQLSLGNDSLLSLLSNESFFPESMSLESTVEDATMQVMGPTGDQDPHLIKYHRYNENNIFKYNRIAYRTVKDRESSVHFEYTRSELSPPKFDNQPSQASLSDEKIKLNQIISPETGAKLIELFYKFVNPQFPILSVSEIPSPNNCPTHLLAAIYLISEQFADFDDYLCIEIVYKSTPLKDLFEIAWRLICQSIDRPSISTMQACLILLLTSPTDPLRLDQPFKWSLFGMITNMAQTLGLHLKPDLWRIPPEEILLRKNLSWLIYAVDKWFAFSFGRPPTISEDNWLVTQIHPVSSEASSTDAIASRYLIQFSGLTKILDTVLRQLFSLKALDSLRNDYRQTLNLARPLLSELSAWHEHVRAATQYEDDSSGSFTYRNLASLELGYHSIQLLIFRAILHSFRSDISVVQEQEALEWKNSNAQSRTAAKNAIIAAHNFAASLSTEQFQPFWAPWTRTCFSITCSVCFVLIVTSRSRDEAAEYKTILDRARRALRTQSRSFEMMRFALLKVDAVFWVGFDKVFRSDLEMGGNF